MRHLLAASFVAFTCSFIQPAVAQNEEHGVHEPQGGGILLAGTGRDPRGPQQRDDQPRGRGVRAEVTTTYFQRGRLSRTTFRHSGKIFFFSSSVSET
jgi:hypothetical protein